MEGEKHKPFENKLSKEKIEAVKEEFLMNRDKAKTDSNTQGGRKPEPHFRDISIEEIQKIDERDAAMWEEIKAITSPEDYERAHNTFKEYVLTVDGKKLIVAILANELTKKRPRGFSRSKQ